MNNPNSLSIDASGRLWVADRDNNRILRFDNASAKTSSSTADGVLGQPDFVTSASGLTAANMSAPASVFADMNGRVWVADRVNNRILRFDNAASKTNGATADGVLGQPDFTTGTSGLSATKMNRPMGVYDDAIDHLWVCEDDNNRVIRFDSASSKSNGSLEKKQRHLFSRKI